MDYLTAANNGLIKSGNVVGFKKAKNLLDRWIQFFTGQYYHIAIIWVDPSTNIPYVYTAKYSRLVLEVFGPGFLHFDVIETNIDFNRDVKRFADSLLGQRYSWINFALVAVDLNSSKFGYICSTLVGAILAAANDSFDTRGLTPSQLVKDLLGKGCKVTTVDSQG